ncbi:MAG: nucleoside transporter C-terminal domain-containing protein [Prosthecobacter sp.]|nr:nucleoside transporter C-terminal domain-containing protein [Prosthecobacter sp.]
MPERLIGFLGLLVFIVLAWLLSTNRRRFPWRTVVTGLALQFIIGLLALRTQAGAAVFSWLDQAFLRLLGFADEGNKLVFGPLGDRDFLTGQWGAPHSFIFAISITGTIVLIAAISSFLYHYGILQRIVRAAAWIMERLMRTSGSESLAAAANIFMGQTEAPMVVKPYLKGMTRSEIMALMTGGMATIAGGVLAAYVGFGISAGHLITASIMSAPAALMMAKIMLPETEVSETAAGARADIERETTNGIDALCRGAADGIKLSINVMAMLIAFVAIVALANFLIAWVLNLGGVAEPKPLQHFFAWINAPFAWLMGVPWRDCSAVGSILGERIVLNEFVAYYNLKDMIKAVTVDPRSSTIATYALCGFANFGSIAIQIGGIGSVVPERRADLASLGVKAMIAGLLACYCTASIAGLLT